MAQLRPAARRKVPSVKLYRVMRIDRTDKILPGPFADSRAPSVWATLTPSDGLCNAA